MSGSTHQPLSRRHAPLLMLISISSTNSLKVHHDDRIYFSPTTNRWSSCWPLELSNAINMENMNVYKDLTSHHAAVAMPFNS